MSEIAIRVENLSKQFRIGAPEHYRTLRDTLTDTVTAPFRRLRRGGSPKTEAETIWALKDVSFEIKHGEVIGVIGRNGAGKSTLLKILSRITEPTKGRVQIHGRVGSLLEVGTGFHPELTGRENIFLNGAILGMKRAEILRKFDEIVAFAEVDKFIDTPVKHYSSGMYVRLAFAVAAHMEPEILIVDEVLAVGDAQFQDKCLGKIRDASKGGRTVVFVSHNMASISALCSRAILLESGEIERDASARECVARYLSPLKSSEPGGPFLLAKRGHRADRDKSGVRLLGIRAIDSGGEPVDSVLTGDCVQFQITVESEVSLSSAAFDVSVADFLRGTLFVSSSSPLRGAAARLDPGIWSGTISFPYFPFSPGTYTVGVSVTRPRVQTLFSDEHAALLSVGPNDLFDTGLCLENAESAIMVPHEWTVLQESNAPNACTFQSVSSH